MNEFTTTGSIWTEVKLPRFSSLDRDLDVDVLVVGGGLTGLTTAYLMAREGIRVALIERARLASADTARTTAHLTYVTDERFHRLVEKFGKDAAAEFWHGGSYAIDTIERICAEAHADAQFVRIPGYLHAPIGDSKGEQLQSLREDAELAAECGFEAEFVDAVPHALQP
ncbi:MAG TPA: FAD-dependent oxidoreductase, partial [Povalibacter sp.]